MNISTELLKRRLRLFVVIAICFTLLGACSAIKVNETPYLVEAPYQESVRTELLTRSPAPPPPPPPPTGYTVIDKMLSNLTANGQGMRPRRPPKMRSKTQRATLVDVAGSESELAAASGNQNQMATSNRHPCTVTASDLSEEDCKAAQYWLDQSKLGAASVSAPTWMLQGQTKLVTLAVGYTPSSSDGSSMTPHQVAKNAADNSGGQVYDDKPFVGRKMSADLAISDGFDVESIRPRVQTVSDGAVTTWEWKVTAKGFGKKTLIINTAVVMIDNQGNPVELKPTTHYREVKVWIWFDGLWYIFKSVPDALKVVSAALLGIAAVIAAWKTLKKASRRR